MPIATHLSGDSNMLMGMLRAEETAEMATLREEVRSRDILELEVGGVRTRFFDARGSLAACHRAGWFYEPKMLNRIADLARKGVYLDVGANMGNHTVFFAQHCPATAVHSFEPLNFIFALLEENVRLNDLSNVSLYPFGLGAVDGEFKTQMGRRTFPIACRRLDDLRIEGPLAVVKVDIEGMELQFLRGAQKTLLRERPLIYLEAHTDAELADLETALAGLSYRRTGRVFNATPTYEFAPDGDALLS
jgi:FkbM family methyltransferase